MTNHTKRAIIVVPAADRAAANAAAAPIGGPNTFSVGLVQAGDPAGTPPRAYWCSWQLTPAERAALQDAFQSAGILARAHLADVDHWDPAVGRPTPTEVLTARGLRVSE